MADALLAGDGLWGRVRTAVAAASCSPIWRPRIEDRVAFTAILFVLLTGLSWRLVPAEIGCSAVTAWRRLRDWQAIGAWARCIANC